MLNSKEIKEIENFESKWFQELRGATEEIITLMI